MKGKTHNAHKPAWPLPEPLSNVTHNIELYSVVYIKNNYQSQYFDEVFLNNSIICVNIPINLELQLIKTVLL